MKKPIRDNWHNVSIVVCAFFIMSFSYIFYKTFIEHIVLNIRFPVLHLLLEGGFYYGKSKKR